MLEVFDSKGPLLVQSIPCGDDHVDGFLLVAFAYHMNLIMDNPLRFSVFLLLNLMVEELIEVWIWTFPVPAPALVLWMMNLMVEEHHIVSPIRGLVQRYEGLPLIEMNQMDLFRLDPYNLDPTLLHQFLLVLKN